MERHQFNNLASILMRAKNMIFFIDHFQPAREKTGDLIEKLREANRAIAKELKQLEEGR